MSASVMQLLIATTNAGKVREFRQMLGDGRFAWHDLSEFPGGDVAPVEETGQTFRANACLKATHYARALKMWTLADDSGLAVDALDGKPGVHSARWAKMHAQGNGDADNNKLLLQQLASVPEQKRTARFICVLALADPSGRIILTAQDSVEGRVGREGRGDNGFGYDPLFLVENLGKTAAELPPEQKHALSHRGKALRRMKGLMQRIDAFIPSPGTPGEG
jgi:XTP/dITP diphosphohydrolase